MKARSRVRKAAGLLLFVGMLVAGVRGQSVLDGFDPNANGNVNVVIVQPDGKILIGGQFTNVLGVTRNRITSQNRENQPAPDGDNFPNSPDSTSDIDNSDGGSDDLSPHISARNYQDTPLFCVTGRDAVTRGTSRLVPILLFPVHCFYCLHEHIRERAPPIPV